MILLGLCNKGRRQNSLAAAPTFSSQLQFDSFYEQLKSSAIKCAKCLYIHYALLITSIAPGHVSITNTTGWNLTRTICPLVEPHTPNHKHVFSLKQSQPSLHRSIPLYHTPSPPNTTTDLILQPYLPYLKD